MKDKLIVL